MRTLIGAAAFALLALVPADADAQRHRGRHMGEMGPPERGGIERLLRMSEELELTEDQFERLDALRQEAVRERSERQIRAADLASRVRAGLAEPEEMRAFMEEQREWAAERRTSHRERIEGILSEQQRERLEELGARQMRRGHVLRHGRGMHRGGPGARLHRRHGPRGGAALGHRFRMNRGFGPAFRGRALGPRGFLRGPRRGGVI